MVRPESLVDRMLIEEIRKAAEQHMGADVWKWVNGAAGTASTMRHNIEALERIRFRLRTIRGFEKRDTKTRILGMDVETPAIVAPFARLGRIHPEGELAVAKGAAKVGAMVLIGSASTHNIEEVSEVAKTPLVSMQEPRRDVLKIIKSIHQAEKAGCIAVGLCLDDFEGIKIGEHVRNLPNAPISPEILTKIRKETSLPFIAKGIMTLEDAKLAVDAEVDSIVVSNHGGRVLDYCQATIDVLPSIVKAVGNKVEILIDGGFRTGSDVLKALALGAKGVLIGRPVCWGLAIGGARGVGRVLEVITKDLSRAMGLTGVKNIANVPRKILSSTGI